MRNKLLTLVVSLLLLFMYTGSLAQDKAPVEMADGMRSNGKIYVVIAVILTILTGLILYMVRIDRKISRLEKESA